MYGNQLHLTEPFQAAYFTFEKEPHDMLKYLSNSFRAFTLKRGVYVKSSSRRSVSTKVQFFCTFVDTLLTEFPLCKQWICDALFCSATSWNKGRFEEISRTPSSYLPFPSADLNMEAWELS